MDLSSVDRGVLFECPEHGMFVGGKLTRKRKVCVKCGHPECPACETWCDHTVDAGNGERDLCCDGECTYV